MSIVDELYQKIDEGKEGRNIGLKTGIEKLDHYTGGFKKGVYTLTFSKSSVGKTAIIIYKIYRILKDYPDKDVLFVYFSLELGANILLAKLLSLYIYEVYGLEVTFSELLSFNSKLGEKEYEAVLAAKSWLEDVSKKFLIYDTKLSADSFYAEMKELHEKLGEFKISPDWHRKIYVPKNPELIVDVVIDHLLLVNPQKGRTKKEEMDLISTYAVWFREKCQTSFDIIMQENRGATSMDRRKAGLEEPTPDDIQASGEIYQACDVCIALFSPFKTQLKTYRGYKIVDDELGPGLQDICRSCIILKNRYGIANRIVMTAFKGSIGQFQPLPSNDKINYDNYIDWREKDFKDVKQEDLEKKDDEKKVKFKF